MNHLPPHRRSTPPGTHRPVMLDQVLAVLQPRPSMVALDCTLGHGGHAAAILSQILPDGRLIALDWDAENLRRAETSLQGAAHVSLHHQNFAAAVSIIAAAGLDGVDLLLADLGMSSIQLDDNERGFSYLRDGPLDMRMDRSRGHSAADLLARISESDLAQALHDLGDEPQARLIARALVEARSRAPLLRTSDVVRVIGEALRVPVSRSAGWRLRTASGQWQAHPAARTFQALRMLVNRELNNLHELLRTLPLLLRPGGTAAIISFHSGEDRLVKAAFRKYQAAGRFEIADQPLRPTVAERQANPRARSAKLRWARKPA